MRELLEFWRKELTFIGGAILAYIAGLNSLLGITRFQLFLGLLGWLVVYLAISIWYWKKNKTTPSKLFGTDGANLETVGPIIEDKLRTFLGGAVLFFATVIAGLLWWYESFVIVSNFDVISAPTRLESGKEAFFAVAARREDINPSKVSLSEFALRLDVTPNKPDCRIQEIYIEVSKYDPVEKSKPATTGFPQDFNIYYLEIDEGKTGRFDAQWDYEHKGPTDLSGFAKFVPKKLTQGSTETVVLRINALVPGIYTFKAYMKIATGQYTQRLQLDREWRVLFDDPALYRGTDDESAVPKK